MAEGGESRGNGQRLVVRDPAETEDKIFSWREFKVGTSQSRYFG